MGGWNFGIILPIIIPECYRVKKYFLDRKLVRIILCETRSVPFNNRFCGTYERAHWRDIQSYRNFYLSESVSKNAKCWDSPRKWRIGSSSLYLALAQKKLSDCIRSKKRQKWQLLRSKDCKDSFNADGCSKIFSRSCCAKHKRKHKRGPGLFKEEFPFTERLYLSSTAYCCYNSLSNKFKFSSKGPNKRSFEDSGDWTMAQYRKVLGETENVNWTNRGFRTKNHCVATYERTKKRIFFYS